MPKLSFPLLSSAKRDSLGKDLDMFLKRFNKRALHCCDPMDKEVLVNVCLHGMMEKYIIFLGNLSFTSFSRLIEAARRTTESVAGP